MNAQAATAKLAADAPILLREDKGGIAILTLNRPQARNSLSEAMLESARRCTDRDRARAFGARRRSGRERSGLLRRS